MNGEREEIIGSGSSVESSQTQLLAALKNHIDLSSMADNKANILLSVNAGIIAVVMTYVEKTESSLNNYMIPIVILLSVCVVSLVFATRATRPMKMDGITNLDNILHDRTSLFYFGNYFKMSFEEYRSGLKTTLQSEAMMEAQIIHDLYFLGKVLGNKYSYLRKCHNVFMYGLVLSVLAFVVCALCQKYKCPGISF